MSLQFTSICCVVSKTIIDYGGLGWARWGWLIYIRVIVGGQWVGITVSLFFFFLYFVVSHSQSFYLVG